MFPKFITFAVAALLAPVAAFAQTSNGAVTLPNIDTVIRDMSSESELLAIKPSFDFQYRAQTIMYSPSGVSLPKWWTGNRPEWCYSALTWFTSYEAQGNAATNTRVQVRNLRMYILSNATRKWTSIDVKLAPNTELWKYPFVYAGGTDKAGIKSETTGGISFKPAYPLFHHGYGTPVKLVDPKDVRAVYVGMDFRLVVDDPKKPDDRAKAKYVVNAGADYYPGGKVTWGVGYAPGVGGSKYLVATNAWRTAAMLVPNKLLGATMAEMKTNSPPLTLASK